MIAKVSVKGQTVIPEAIREQARIKKGDELDVGYANGLVVMRKRQPFDAARVRKLLLLGRRLPEMTPKDETTVRSCHSARQKPARTVKVVFDTNVVASASFWRGPPFDCLRVWSERRCDAAVSPPLLAEYHETTLELKLEYPKRIFVPWAELLTETAIMVFPSDRATGATPDPDDEMVLECAQAAEADAIISGDKKHLLALRDFRGITIISPVEFLRLLAAED